MDKDFKFFTKHNLRIFLVVFIGSLAIGVFGVLFLGLGDFQGFSFVTAILTILIILVLLVRVTVNRIGKARLRRIDNSIHTALTRLERTVSTLFAKN